MSQYTTSMSEQRKKQKLAKDQRSWIKLATQKKPECAVPVAAKMFQADIPSILSGNPQDPDSSSKWLGNQVWPPQEFSNDPTTRDNQQEQVIGKGRLSSSSSSSCKCQGPGLIECVNLHVSEEKNKLRTELGYVFEEWGFDQMGEGVREGWSEREENKFEEMIERKSGRQKVKVQFLDKYFWNKDRIAIVNYFYNVYCPRKFAQRTRAGIEKVQTDDEDEEKEEDDNDEGDNSRSNTQTPRRKGTDQSEMGADKRSMLKKWDSSESKKKVSLKNNKYMAGFR